jgi:hypothetical protein
VATATNPAAAEPSSTETQKVQESHVAVMQDKAVNESGEIAVESPLWTLRPGRQNSNKGGILFGDLGGVEALQALDNKTQATTRPAAKPQEPLGPDEIELIHEVAGVESDVWFELSHWAKEANALNPWERSLAYGLGIRKAHNLEPTFKQARQGKRILAAARDLGFSPGAGDART